MSCPRPRRRPAAVCQAAAEGRSDEQQRVGAREGVTAGGSVGASLVHAAMGGHARLPAEAPACGGGLERAWGQGGVNTGR